MTRESDIDLAWDEDLTAEYDDGVSRIGLIVLAVLSSRSFFGGGVEEILADVHRRGFPSATRDMVEAALGDLIEEGLIDQGPKSNPGLN